MKTVSLNKFNEVSHGKGNLFTLGNATKGAVELQMGEWAACEAEDGWTYNVVAVTAKGPQGDFTVGHGIEVIDEDGEFTAYWTI